MERHISLVKVETELEEIVKKFDPLKEFLGDDLWKGRFLSDYRALRAQLKDGDELRMEIGNGMGEDASYGFNIVFYPKQGDKKIRSHYTISGTMYAKDTCNVILYDD